MSAAVTQTSVESLLKQASDCQGHLEITDRQREILRLLAQGMAVKAVADVLGVCIGTVNFHKYRAMALLNLKSNANCSVM